MKTFLLYLFEFILCVVGFWFLDIAFPEMNTQQSIALAFAIVVFYFYFRLLTYIHNGQD